MGNKSVEPIYELPDTYCFPPGRTPATLLITFSGIMCRDPDYANRPLGNGTYIITKRDQYGRVYEYYANGWSIWHTSIIGYDNVLFGNYEDGQGRFFCYSYKNCQFSFPVNQVSSSNPFYGGQYCIATMG